MIERKKSKIKRSQGYPRKHRIGIDMDTKNRLTFLIKYFNARRFGKVIPFETLHGYHLHIFMKDRTPEMNMHIRNIIGDCEGRMNLDYGRYIEGEYDIMETMFYDKQVYDERGGEELIHPLSQAFYMVTK